MRICCISDTHELHRELEIPPCDLLLHAGDTTMRGVPAAFQDFDAWCASLLEKGIVRKIIIIAGNHDLLFEKNSKVAQSLVTASTYLQDSGIEWQEKFIWGSPWQPWFFDWAFNLRTEEELKQKFENIPAGTDILLSHGPPNGILDRTQNGESVGSRALLERVRTIRPKLVVFGHIHESYGIVEQQGISFVNASICNVRYNPVNKPIVIDLD